MITAAVLGVYAALVGVAAPYALVRARWTHYAPAPAILVWLGLMTTFILTTALALHHLFLAEQHVHSHLTGFLDACGIHPVTTGGGSAPIAAAAALVVPALVVLLPVGWFLRSTWSARRDQHLHVDMLTLVASPAPEHGAVILDHDTPAVYCLPGAHRRVVMTRGAVEALTEQQLRAVLAHERAHIAGRHHHLHAVTRAFDLAFPKLPLARSAREQIALLLEMVADDRALRSHPRTVLASAMCQVAAGPVPQAALGAGGPSVMIRVPRVLTPQKPPRPVTWLGILAGSLAAPLLPLLTACGTGFG